MHIEPIPAFKDNYIWSLLHPTCAFTLCVDPGDAKPVEQFLQQCQRTLTAILITHHHWDHTHGLVELMQQRNIPVFGPAHTVDEVTHPLTDRQVCSLPEFDLEFEVLAIAGHTLDHLAYYGHGILFCGDTLFAGGCGRLFEGSATQMYQSLQQLAALPSTTQVYCAHEYTLTNLQFALQVEPENTAIQQRLFQVQKLRTQQQPSLPTSIGLELATNPFLRVTQPTVIDAAQRYADQALTDPVDVFAALRDWKDHF